MGKKDKKAGGGDDGPKKTMLLGRSSEYAASHTATHVVVVAVAYCISV